MADTPLPSSPHATTPAGGGFWPRFWAFLAKIWLVGTLLLIVFGVLIAFFILKVVISVAEVAKTVDTLPLQPRDHIEQIGPYDGTGNTQAEQFSNAQLHVIGVDKGLPADGEEDPVWWQKCENEGIDSTSIECHQKYASIEEEGIVNVKVMRKDGPLILAFMASEPTTWKVDIAEGVTVERIILAGQAAQKIHGKPADIPLSIYTKDPSPCDDCYQDNDYFYGYDEDGNLRNAMQKLQDITGRAPASFQGRVQGDTFAISDATPPWKPTHSFMLR